MRKLIKIILSIFSGIILTVIIIPVIASILLSSYTVQNFVISKAAKAATEYLGTTVSIDKIYIKLFNRVQLKGLYVEDFSGDTLLYASKIDVALKGYNPLTGLLRLGDVELLQAKFFLAQDSSLKMNLTEILDKIKSKKPKEKSQNDFMMRVSSLKITDTHFKLRKYIIPEKPYGINFSDLDVRNINMELDKIGMVNDSINAQIREMSFREKSGFNCKELSANDVKVSSRGMIINKMTIIDNNSNIKMKFLNFDYPTWSAYKDFITAVNMSTSIVDSKISSQSIAFFAPTLRKWQSNVRATAVVNGTVSDLRADLSKILTRDTELTMKLRITGLPNAETTNFMFDVEQLRTNAADADYIYGDITGKSLSEATKYLKKMEKILLKGRFDGLLSDFIANASVNSVVGDMKFNVHVNPLAAGQTKIKGEVSLGDFALGTILDSKTIGSTTMTANLDGYIYKDSIALATNATINRLAFNGYIYSDIKINGKVNNKLYTGFVGCNDPNLDFELNGLFDLNSKIPKYDFALNLKNADLYKLGVNKRDSISILKCNITANAAGTTINDIDGSGSITDIFYQFNQDTVISKEIKFIGNNNDSNKLIAIYSDFADIELRSRLNFYDLIPYFKSTLHRYMPSLSIDSDSTKIKSLEAKLNTQTNSADNYYILKAKVKESSKFAGAFVPELYIAQGTDLSFMFNPATDNFSLTLTSDLIEYKNIYVADLNLTNRNQSDSISVFIRTSETGIGSVYMPDFSLIGGAKNNMLNLGLGFMNKENKSSALINTTTSFTKNSLTELPNINLKFNTSQIRVGDQFWQIISPRITFQKGMIDIEKFRLVSSGQELSLSGVISDNTKDTLRINLNNFDLTPLSGIIDRYGFNVSGTINGKADIIAATGDRLFYSKITFEDIKINDKALQNSIFESNWDNENERIRVLMTTKNGDKIITGGYKPVDKRYFFDINIPNIELAYLQAVLGGVLSDIEGNANAKLIVTGKGDKPLLNGSILIPYFSGIVDFTNVRYSLNNSIIEVNNNNLLLKKTKLFDDNMGEADIEMALNTYYLSDLSYELKIIPRKLLALNTTAKNNELFYGTAYASGSVGIKGNKRGVVMNINATTENNSTFFLPLSSNTSISEADFIVFENPTQKSDSVHSSRRQIIEKLQKKKSSSTQSNLDINLLLNVLPNTEVQLEPINSHVIKANGKGSLSMRVKPNEGIFTLSGDYVINEGSYEFTLPILPVGKLFTIEKGSSIQWTGNPLDAILNITAVYRIRASLAPLLSSNDAGFRQNVPVNCEIILTDRLLQPDINFNVEVPTADTEIQSIIRSAMNTQEMKSSQFIYLLAFNSFYADNNANTNTNIGTVASVSTGIEFLTNQISNWFSSDKMKFNFGYRPKSELSSDEIDFSYSQELIPNKLSIEAEANYNLGNNQGINSNADSPLTGDFYITYIFDKIGNLRARAFTRTIDRFDENQGLQESGVGLYYTKDFNTFRDLFKRKKKKVVK